MSRLPRVLLDVDGPLTRGFIDVTCAKLRRRGYPDAHPSRATDWDIMRGFGVTPAVEAEVRFELRGAGVATSFEPRAGAYEFVEDLRQWADVRAVTAPLDGSLTWAAERERWLERVLRFPLASIYSARDKSPIRGDAFVDDRPEHVAAWQAENPAGIAVLWLEPYNVRAKWAGPRAGDYRELGELLGALRPPALARAS